ncbi:Uncharacterized protein SCF082_LOCUS40958 [Durusdinium trenchii]|uniref:Uncharacterized protein n=1 Tax=Durusdinium trenchii TaxID=1381693 RepID=A0ABP0QF00_9DINO
MASPQLKAVVVADNVGLMEINDYAEHVRSSGSYLSASVASEALNVGRLRIHWVEYFTEDERGPLSDAMEVSVYLGENSQRELAADSSQLDPSRRHMEWMLVTGMVKGHAFVFTRPSLWCSSLHHVQRARRHGDVVVPEPYSRDWVQSARVKRVDTALKRFWKVGPFRWGHEYGWLWHSCGQFSLMTYGAAAHRPFDEKPTTVGGWKESGGTKGLNYWREATVGFRRRIDMLAVAVTVMLRSSVFRIGSGQYHSCVAFGVLGNGLDAPPTALLCHPVRPFLGPSTRYALLTICFVSMYLRARFWAAKKEFQKSTPWHLAVHAMGNFGNLMMYPGLRP